MHSSREGSSRCFLLTRIRSAARLSRGELWLALRAMAWLVAARLALATLGFRRVRRHLEAMRPRGPGRDDFPAALRRAMARASRTVPGSACLAQAVAAYRLLCADGHPAELTIGVRRGAGPEPPLAAHAWVRSGNVLVTGDADGADISRFTELAHIRARA